MSTIDEYDAEYRGHVQACEEKLALAESASLSSDAGRTALHAAERAAEAAKDVIQLMDLEGRSLSGSARSKLQTTLRGYREEAAALKARLKVVRTTSRSTPQSADRIREELYAGSGQHSDDESSRMLANNERIGQGTDRLKNAHQVTLDMEDTANSILGDLSKQRETLKHAKGTLKYASEGLDASRRVLTQMARRAAMNKATLYIVIALLLGMVLLILWATGGGGSDEAAPAKAAQGIGGTANEGGWTRAPGV
jgi:vesicle transport through interaction with t-SNAREs protein 1